jgi:SAM-dependent methyltransferase
LAELNDVTGKSLLHLQCHFGLDTLSWAREGAIVTGVDFSEPAVQFAQQLSQECDIPAKFICTDIYKLPDLLPEKFDIVFTSYGALTWLYDIEQWAKIVTHFLKPDGILYLVEFHPFTYMFNDAWDAISNPYFYSKDPLITQEQGSYANKEADFSGTAYEWPHTIGEIVTALCKVGLKIEFLHEFPYSPYNCFPSLEEINPSEFAVKGKNIPLTFSIKATLI